MHKNLMAPETVEEHWQRFVAGDRNAMGEVYRAFHQRLTLFCLGKLRDRELAADAASETLNKVLTHDDPGSIRNIGQWLFTVARNHCMSQLSTEKRHREIESGMQAFVPSQTRPEGEMKVQADQLNQMRQQVLTEKEAAVWQFNEQGYANQEIGSQLDMSEKTVANHKANARVKLRALLQKLQNE